MQTGMYVSWRFGQTYADEKKNYVPEINYMPIHPIGCQKCKSGTFTELWETSMSHYAAPPEVFECGEVSHSSPALKDGNMCILRKLD